MYVKHNPEKTIIKISLLLSGKCLKWRKGQRENMEGGWGAQEQKYMGEKVRQVISSSQSSFLSPKESVSHLPLILL